MYMVKYSIPCECTCSLVYFAVASNICKCNAKEIYKCFDEMCLNTGQLGCQHLSNVYTIYVCRHIYYKAGCGSGTYTCTLQQPNIDIHTRYSQEINIAFLITSIYRPKSYSDHFVYHFT